MNNYGASMELYLQGKTESTLSENLSQCPSVKHKYHIEWHGIEPRSSRWDIVWAMVRPSLVAVMSDRLWNTVCTQISFPIEFSYR